jgi:membrane protease YdiL (CAAX protease family)
MTAIGLGRADRLVRPALLGVGLTVVVGTRWAATVAGLADGISIGLIFGLSLALLAFGVGWRPTRDRWSSVPLGLAGGGLLVAVALASRSPASAPFAAAAAFGPWAAVTILVAVAEEAVLRGALFDALEDAAGTTATVVLTSLVFGLIHVPLYGWHVVPLDTGVGLLLAGLRLGTGGVAAPGLAHALADLATWWL